MPGGNMEGEFKRGRLIFRRDHVLLEKHPVKTLRIDRDMRCPALRRLHAAEFEPHPIVPGGGKLGAHIESVMRPKFNAGLVGDPQLLRLLALPVITEIERVPALGKFLRCRRRQSFIHDRLGRGQILFHMRRRQRHHGTDAFEAMPVWILRQSGRVRRIEIHAEQIADGMGVFLAGQPVERDPLAFAQAGRLALLELRRDPLDHERRLLRLGLRLVLRRHLAGTDPLHRISPVRGGQRSGKIPRQGVQPKVPLLFLLAVTTKAVLFQKRLDGHNWLGEETARRDNSKQGRQQQGLQ